jgi:6-pyruvoyl-tetrahydropterin synthase
MVTDTSGIIKSWDFINFLADIANKLDEAFIDNSQLKPFLIKHIVKVIREAQIYSDYLNGKYQEAEKKQLSHNKDQKPEGEDWCFYNENSINYYKFHYPSVYFHSKKDRIYFWMKGKPKPDPLDYLSNMIEDIDGKPHQDLEPDDYKCFLLSCIYDNQRMAAGQERIYFEPNDTKELKNRICRAVWQGLRRDRGTYETKTLQNLAQTIKTTLQQLLRTVSSKVEEPEGNATPAKEWWITTLFKNIIEKGWQIFTKSFWDSVFERWGPK